MRLLKPIRKNFFAQHLRWISYDLVADINDTRTGVGINVSETGCGIGFYVAVVWDSRSDFLEVQASSDSRGHTIKAAEINIVSGGSAKKDATTRSDVKITHAVEEGLLESFLV